MNWDYKGFEITYSLRWDRYELKFGDKMHYFYSFKDAQKYVDQHHINGVTREEIQKQFYYFLKDYNLFYRWKRNYNSSKIFGDISISEFVTKVPVDKYYIHS